MESSRIVVTSGDFVKERVGAIRDVYRIGNKLGDGAFGSVRKITHRVTGEVRALDHPNILKLFEFYQDVTPLAPPPPSKMTRTTTSSPSTAQAESCTTESSTPASSARHWRPTL